MGSPQNQSVALLKRWAREEDEIANELQHLIGDHYPFVRARQHASQRLCLPQSRIAPFYTLWAVSHESCDSARSLHQAGRSNTGRHII